MKKYLVLYYSGSGNNRFLAQELAKTLNCDIKEIIPRMNFQGLQILLSLCKTSLGTNISPKDLEPYDEIIIMGPIWAGQLLSPLRNTIGKCINMLKPIHYATCCGTSDEQKDEKFGYEHILEQVRKLGGKWIKTAMAFPIVLILDEEEANDSQTVMKARITQENFNGRIKKRFDSLVDGIKFQSELQKL